MLSSFGRYGFDGYFDKTFARTNTDEPREALNVPDVVLHGTHVAMMPHCLVLERLSTRQQTWAPWSTPCPRPSQCLLWHLRDEGPHILGHRVCVEWSTWDVPHKCRNLRWYGLSFISRTGFMHTVGSPTTTSGSMSRKIRFMRRSSFTWSRIDCSARRDASRGDTRLGSCLILVRVFMLCNLDVTSSDLGLFYNF